MKLEDKIEALANALDKAADKLDAAEDAIENENEARALAKYEEARALVTAALGRNPATAPLRKVVFKVRKAKAPEVPTAETEEGAAF